MGSQRYRRPPSVQRGVPVVPVGGMTVCQVARLGGGRAGEYYHYLSSLLFSSCQAPGDHAARKARIVGPSGHIPLGERIPPCPSLAGWRGRKARLLMLVPIYKELRGRQPTKGQAAIT